MGFVFVAKASKKPKVRRPKVTVTYKRLEALGKQMGNAMRLDLTTGITAFKKRVPKAVMADAFESGDYLAALRLIPWDKLPEDLEDAFGTMASTLGETAQIQLSKMTPNVNKNLRFDLSNPAIRSYLATHTGSLITSIEDSARDNVRGVIASSFSQAQTPRQLAERIKSSIGLLPAHERALANYKTGLQATDISAKEVTRLADAYEDRLLDYRANMIARTETRSAINNGQLAVWREGVNQGLIERQSAYKEYITDGAPCEICEPMNGTRVPIDEPFIVDGEAFDAPPVHPHCMCGMELHFGSSDDVETEE